MTPWRSRSMRKRPSRWQARIRSTRLAKPNLRSSNEASTLRRNCFAWRMYIGQRGGFCADWNSRRTSRIPSADARLGGGGFRRVTAPPLESRGLRARAVCTHSRWARSARAGILGSRRHALGELHEDVPARFAQHHVAGGGELLREVAEAAGAVGALGERRVELQQRALQQARAAARPRDRVSTFSARRTSGTACSSEASAPPRPARSGARDPGERRGADEVLVGDELVAVPLHHQARERAAADHEDLLVVLLQLLDERDEVAVAADDDVGVDVAVGERHLERVERQVDVGAVLVAARREVALHQLGRVLRERSAVVAGARPVAVGDLGHDVAALLERLEDDPDVELHAERALDPDLDVVEVDENRNLQSCVCQNVPCFPSRPNRANGGHVWIVHRVQGSRFRFRFEVQGSRFANPEPGSLNL